MADMLGILCAVWITVWRLIGFVLWHLLDAIKWVTQRVIRNFHYALSPEHSRYVYHKLYILYICYISTSLYTEFYYQETSWKSMCSHFIVKISLENSWMNLYVYRTAFGLRTKFPFYMNIWKEQFRFYLKSIHSLFVLKCTLLPWQWPTSSFVCEKAVIKRMRIINFILLE